MAAVDEFVGRHREIDTLLKALSAACDGHGGIALIAGEPGVGKTRVAMELGLHCAHHDARMPWGRCHEDEGAPPYWPWAQIVRGVAEAIRADEELRADLDSGAPDLLDLVPVLRSRFPDIEPPTALSDPAQSRFRLFGSVTRFLGNVSRRHPLILVLDDLHWADVSSLRLLEHLAQELADNRILVVGTYRDTDLSRRHRLSDTLGALARTPRLVRLHLTGLGIDDVNHFIAGAVGVTPPAWLTRTIHEQTEGNPLFVREVTRLLLDQGHFDGKAIVPQMRLPEGVREVIGRRLNMLSPACNDTLALAAVIGREFALDILLGATADRIEAEILELLDEALTARIIEEIDNHRYQFTHTLVRATLYDELRAGQRRRMHHAVGEAIERLRSADLDPVLADLSHHFRTSGLTEDNARAIDYTIRAGLRADAAVAFEDAITFFQNALDLTDSAPERCDLLLRIGHAQRKTSLHGEALTNLRSAIEIARRLDDPSRFAAAALAYDDAAWRSDLGENGDGASVLEEALTRVPGTDMATRAKLLSNLARELMYLGRSTDSERLGLNAIAVARASGDPNAVAHAIAGRTDRPSLPTEAVPTLAEANEMADAARRAGELELLLRAQLRRVPVLLELNRVQEALEAIGVIDQLNARTRQPLFLLMGMVAHASIRQNQGNLAEAERQIRATRDRRLAGVQTTDPVALPTFELLREQGRLRTLAPVIAGFLSQNPAIALWNPGLALLHIEIGDSTAARRVFHEAIDTLEQAPSHDARMAASLVYLTEVCVALDERSRAAGLYTRLQPWTGHNLVMGSLTGFWGAGDRFLGMLATLMGEFETAQIHTRAALAMNAHNGLNLPLAKTHCDYVNLLLARGSRDDHALAREHLEAAERLAKTFGLTAVALRAAELHRMMETPARATPAPPDGLTAREIDVLRLIAIGRNNADIALVLSIGQSTVATHVHNILTKTGCANRTEAAAYARDHGIVETR